MNTYILICDIGYGVEEFYTVTMQAPSVTDAIEKFALDEWKDRCDGVPIEELPDKFTNEDISEMVDEIIEIQPGTYRQWNAYSYFMLTHDGDSPLYKYKFNFIQGIYDNIESSNKEFKPINIPS